MTYYAAKYRNGRLIKVPHETAWGIIAVEVSGIYRKRSRWENYRSFYTTVACVEELKALMRKAIKKTKFTPPSRL